jgi:hypothetical protein
MEILLGVLKQAPVLWSHFFHFICPWLSPSPPKNSGIKEGGDNHLQGSCHFQLTLGELQMSLLWLCVSPLPTCHLTVLKGIRAFEDTRYFCIAWPKYSLLCWILICLPNLTRSVLASGKGVAKGYLVGTEYFPALFVHSCWILILREVVVLTLYW